MNLKMGKLANVFLLYFAQQACKINLALAECIRSEDRVQPK